MITLANQLQEKLPSLLSEYAPDEFNKLYLYEGLMFSHIVEMEQFEQVETQLIEALKATDEKKVELP